ncbi:MAG: Omp28 family outer membrane lipoprotein [Bacteroidaceae bacterium]|nr:Omp28 family outer membrane lipoprotein [Bacteroidaceae bacterium]
MKRTLLNIIAFVFALVAFVSCDVIPENDRYIEVEDQGGERVQRLLIEEFTGHKCVNCPDGAAIVHEIQEYYPGRVVVVGIHAGMLATPTGEFAKQNFMTADGTKYYNEFGVQGNPAALLNREHFAGEDWAVRTKEKWMTYAISELGKEPVCEVLPTVTYNAETRELSVETEVEAYENMPADLNLQVQIVENVIGMQLKSGDVIDEEYEHNHVFRTSVNGTWGEAIESLPAGEKKTYTCTTTFNEKWVPENSAVVVFVYENSSKRVLQCNQAAVVAQ